MEYGFILGIFFLIMFVLFAIIDGRNDARDLLKRKTVENIDEPKYTDYELELINEIDNAYREYLKNAKTLNKNDIEIMESPFYRTDQIIEYYNGCEKLKNGYQVNGYHKWIPIKNNEVVHSVTMENGETIYINL